VLLLTIIQGPDKGRKFQLPDKEPQLIGRSSEALAISDNTVSRRHAELTPDGGAWFLRDLQSQNGTYVNGTRIRDRTQLNNGDQIRVGSSVFLFGSPRELRPDVLRLLRSDELDSEIEQTLGGLEDSMVLAEPEPVAAAVDHLRVIYELTHLTTQTMDRHELLNAVMELVFSEFKPERGFIVLMEAGTDTVIQPAVVKYRSAPKDRDQKTINVSRTILQHVLRRGEGVLSTNAMSDPRFAAGDSIQQFAIRSAICSPIRHRQRIYGAVYIDSSIANYTFTKEQLALMNAVGQHTGLALANADLQAEKLQSERLAAIGETVASLSHSIKNILQGLQGGADVVEMGLKKDDLSVSRNGWGILKRNLDRIVSLSLNMLAFSRQRPVEVEFMQLGPIVEDCAALLELPCKAKGVALIVDVDQEMPPVPLDPSLIHQALMNLMGNALEAVEEGHGAITVRVTYRPTGARGEGSPAVADISVIDNGPGVPVDLRARIFEPFSTTKGVRGTGLGLAVTKRVVDEHGGRIALAEGEGPGATFTITLPAETGRVRDPSETATDKPDFSGV
jgi:signal transduction histidine kinase/pSer/pThr/pTyr-binding forkhead associated (FHA) protein